MSRLNAFLIVMCFTVAAFQFSHGHSAWGWAWTADGIFCLTCALFSRWARSRATR